MNGATQLERKGMKHGLPAIGLRRIANIVVWMKNKGKLQATCVMDVRRWGVAEFNKLLLLWGAESG